MEQQRKQEEYKRLVQKRAPKSKTPIMCLKAFFVGGVICCIGQLIRDFAEHQLHLNEADVATFAAIVLVFLGAALTSVGIYDNIAKFAGAGTVVPITGFANAIVAPAMEFRNEGLVMGVGMKMFSVAGPVLVYGIISSVTIGLLSLLF